MKKLVLSVLFVTMAGLAFAQGAETKDENKPQQREERKRASDVWPAFLAICEFPANPDVVGLRLTLPFSTTQENVTGIDLGLWGRSTYFEGIQVNVLRNDVKEDMAGFQIGLYNSIGCCDLLGLQVGLWNEAGSLRGLQAGLINVAGEARGFQIGLINRSETMYGYQIGLINVIRDAELQFFPIVNFGF